MNTNTLKSFFKQVPWLEAGKNHGLLIAGSLLFGIAMAGHFLHLSSFPFFLVSYLFVTGKVFAEVGRNFKNKIIFDENFLMVVATLAAFAIGDYPEAVAVMLLYQIGEIFQDHAEAKSRKSIGSLLDIRSDSANLITANGVEKVDLEVVALQDLILVKPGERIPLDGKIIEGEAYLDTSALTGESMLRYLEVGDDVLAGCINTNGLLKVQVTSTAATSTVARILELVENAASKKAGTEKFITKLARVYTPVVVSIAVLIAVVPPLFLGGLYSVWIYRAAVFLLVSCPCALVISIPLGFFAGIGGASKQGVLVKGANFLEILAQTHTVVFDKTGTLTKGNFIVSSINPLGLTSQAFLELAAYAESQSNHPIAKSIVNAYDLEIFESAISDYQEIAGKGIQVQVKEQDILIGNETLMNEHHILPAETAEVGTIIHLAINGTYHGYMVIADEIKESSREAIKALKAAGVQKTVMLTGDSWAVARKVAAELGIDEVRAQLLPHQKVEEVEALFQDIPDKKKLVFVGDGMNDAPVLARADIGVAMGGMGSDAAIEAADVVLMKDDAMALVDAIHKSRQTNRLLKQNITFAMGIKLLIMILSVFGFASMWLAVFGDVGVAILAILNSIRALKAPRKKFILPAKFQIIKAKPISLPKNI